MNISLVSKWWWKLENEQGIWQDRAHANYIKDLCIGQIKHRHDDSPIWTDLLKIRHIYMNLKKFQVYNGKGPIWLDAWQGKVPLRHQHPVLFELCNEKNQCSGLDM